MLPTADKTTIQGLLDCPIPSAHPRQRPPNHVSGLPTHYTSPAALLHLPGQRRGNAEVPDGAEHQAEKTGQVGGEPALEEQARDSQGGESAESAPASVDQKAAENIGKAQDILRSKKIAVKSIQAILPSLEDVFIARLRHADRDQA